MRAALATRVRWQAMAAAGIARNASVPVWSWVGITPVFLYRVHCAAGRGGRVRVCSGAEDAVMLVWRGTSAQRG